MKLSSVAHEYCDTRMWDPQCGREDSHQIAEALYWLWKHRTI